jgi:hypothetical protein
MRRCPSYLSLELYLVDPDQGEVRTHVESCVACSRRVSLLREQGAEFDETVYPSLRGPLGLARREVRQLRRWWPAAALSLCAAGLTLMALPQRATVSRDRVKGASFSLNVLVDRSGRAERVDSTGRVPASARIGFEASVPAPCWAAVVSVDAAGVVSRFFPATGESTQIRGGDLPGGAHLDGHSGPERIFAFCAARPLDAGLLLRAIQATIPGGEARVRETQAIAGLPRDVDQASVLLEKVR